MGQLLTSHGPNLIQWRSKDDFFSTHIKENSLPGSFSKIGAILKRKIFLHQRANSFLLE